MLESAFKRHRRVHAGAHQKTSKTFSQLHRQLPPFISMPTMGLIILFVTNMA